MNAIPKTLMTVEHHCLQLLYASLRLYKRGLIDKITASIETHGQLTPVVIVSTDSNQWVLMDGYLRVNALRRLGIDTIDAEVWACDKTQALLTLLTEHQSRVWEVFEEALLLQELQTQHGLSQNALALKIGRDKSWVSRRLSLVEQMPESIQKAVLEGKLSLWSANRIVAPLARANTSHGEYFLSYLLDHAVSTRDLKFFYDHYQRSSHPQRSKMIDDPELFFKAQKSILLDKKANALKLGPAGRWKTQLQSIQNTLKPLISLTPQIFTPYQESEERAQLLDIFNKVHDQFGALTDTIRNLSHAHERHAADYHRTASEKSQSPHHQPAS